MAEGASNIGFVCGDHSPKPQSKFEKRSPKSFIGHFVKRAFPGKDPWGKERLEHMWVDVKSVKEGKLVGLLNNDPVTEMKEKCGDEVTVELAQIEDEYEDARG